MIDIIKILMDPGYVLMDRVNMPQKGVRAPRGTTPPRRLSSRGGLTPQSRVDSRGLLSPPRRRMARRTPESFTPTSVVEAECDGRKLKEKPKVGSGA